jgi:15-cis-phytoene synthase
MSDECADIVKAQDRDRYVASFYLPAAVREAAMPLWAFGCEIARIRYSVSEPQLGEIRLQWWRDTLSSLAEGETQSHPVAAALAQTISAHSLPLQPLHNLVDAHQFDLYADQMASLVALEGYLGETSSVLFQLTQVISIGQQAAQGHADASGYAGICHGLARLLPFIGANAKFLPVGMTADDLVAHGLMRLAQLQELRVGSSALPVYLPVAAADIALQNPKREVALWRRQWHVWRAARREAI